MLSKKEVWREVLVSDNGTKYYVSNLGNVKTVQETILSPYIGNNGNNCYKTVGIIQDGKTCRKSVHRLVAKAFLGDPPENSVVNHIDGNKQNNSVANLEYVTQSENVVHAYKLGLCKTGEEHPKAKISNRTVLHIRMLYALGYTIKDLIAKFSFSDSQIRGIVSYKRRGDSTKGFSIYSVKNFGDKTLKSKIAEIPHSEEIPLIVGKNSSKDYVCLSLEDFFNLVEVDKIIGKRSFK